MKRHWLILGALTLTGCGEQVKHTSSFDFSCAEGQNKPGTPEGCWQCGNEGKLYIREGQLSFFRENEEPQKVSTEGDLHIFKSGEEKPAQGSFEYRGENTDSALNHQNKSLACRRI